MSDFQVLNLETMTSQPKSAHTIDALLANAEKRADQCSGIESQPSIEPPTR